MRSCYTTQFASVLIWLLSSLSAAEVQAVEPFTEEALVRGVAYVMESYPQSYGGSGFGCGFADLDGDGDPDIILIGAADGHVGLFENDGSGQFSDRSGDSGLPLLPQGSSFVAGDYDGDGDLDLYFTQLGLPNFLARNEGNFTFTDVTSEALVGDLGGSKSASFGDYDGDGWLDLYVCNYNGIVDGTADIDNKLYHNLGDGSFEEVAVAQTVDDFGYGFQAIWFDYDRDGDVDLYLSNDRGHLPPLFRGNQLWRNDAGQLVNVSEESGAGVSLFSMGVACGDLDNNGWPDLYCTNLAAYKDGYNPLLLNQGDGTFVESSKEVGVDHWIVSWGSIFFDFDNNGQQDLYVNNMFLPNSLYTNPDDFPFTDIAEQLDITGNSSVSFSSAVADVDGDGDLDLLVNNLTQNVELFINHEGQAHSWIRYQMVGQGNNRFAIGANVDTRVGRNWQYREILAGGNSYIGQNELTLHVGLGDADIVDEVVVGWPGGQTTRTLTNLPSHNTWTLYPPERLGDADGNGVWEESDFIVFDGCFGASFAPGCEMMDFDGDSDVDCSDWEQFLSVWSGPDDPPSPAPCQCPADFNGDGSVGPFDLASLLGSWGPCQGGCQADLNGDGAVGPVDLAQLLGSWGDCF